MISKPARPVLRTFAAWTRITALHPSPAAQHLLGVWAHPDDEAYLSAGLMARTTDAGGHVTCVTATLGEHGFADDDPRSPAAWSGWARSSTPR